jgi:hypothetical protein
MGAKRMMGMVIVLNKFSISVTAATAPNANIVLAGIYKIWLLVKQFKFRVVACSITNK